MRKLKFKTETKIFGNCGMCETKIEKRGHKRTSPVDWDKDKNGYPYYDSKITNKDEILKRIALVGMIVKNSMRKRLLTARFLLLPV
jgi:hypothetical protein